MLKLLPIEWRVGLLAVGALACLASYGVVYQLADRAGYNRADLEWQVKWQKREAELLHQRAEELARQDAANAVAVAEQDATIDQLLREKAALEELARQLEQEAADDVGADRIALDGSAVDRYNRRVAP